MDATAVVLDDSEKLMLMRMAGKVGVPNADVQYWMYLDEHKELMLVGQSISDLFEQFLQYKQR
jgi:protein required for attachment to host cells